MRNLYLIKTSHNKKRGTHDCEQRFMNGNDSAQVELIPSSLRVELITFLIVCSIVVNAYFV